MNLNKKIKNYIRSLYSHVFLFSFFFISIFTVLLFLSRFTQTTLDKGILSVILSIGLVLLLLVVESVVRYFAYLVEDKAHYKYLKEFANKNNLTYTHKVFSPDPRTAVIHGVYNSDIIEVGHFVVFPYNPLQSSYFCLFLASNNLKIDIHKKNGFIYPPFFKMKRNILLDEDFDNHFTTSTNDNTRTNELLDRTTRTKILAYSKEFDLNKIEIKEDRIYIENNSMINSTKYIEDTLALVKYLYQHLP